MPRVLLAVVVGYLVAAVLVVTATVAAMAAFGLSMTATPTSGYLAVNLVLSMAAAAVGGYVCARLAPAGRFAVTVGLLTVLFLIAGALWARANAGSPLQPQWYAALVTLLGASGLGIGAVLQRSQAAGRARRTGSDIS
jgi:hypothetical protein